MDMQSQEINELAEALSKTQGCLMPAIKDSKNPFFKSSYADLHSILNAAKEPLANNGLAVIQTTGIIDAQLCLISTLAHKSGQWIKSVMPIVLAKQDPQSIGSALTYFRRYSYAALVGVAQADDDAESCVDRRPKEAKPTQNAPESFTIDDLMEKLTTIGVIADRASLVVFVKEKSIEHKTSEFNILKSAIANQDNNLSRFAKAYEKRFPIDDTGESIPISSL